VPRYADPVPAANSHEIPLLRRAHPSSGTIAPLSPDGRAALLDWYTLDTPTHLRLTLISTLDGRAAGPDGTSETLTSRVDRTVLGVIRELSDAVLVGAETLRREPALVPRARPLVVLTASGRLAGLRPRMSADAGSPPPVVVVSTPEGAARAAAEHPWIETVVIEGTSDRLPLTEVLSELRARGWRKISAEGGPALAGALVDQGLVDELCLTIAPRLGGSDLLLLGPTAGIDGRPPFATLSSARLRQLLIDDGGALYGRWALSHPRPTS